MISDAGAILLYNIVSSFLHAALFVVGFILLKRISSWLGTVLLSLGLIVVNVGFSFASFFMQGADRAWSMISPSGELFRMTAMPVLVSAVIYTMMIMLTAYALFVAPGNNKNV
jgi:hypothetical protein